jgi:HK97 gp10 family phage protein
MAALIEDRTRLVEREARRLAPKRTGELQRSINGTTVRRGKKIVGRVEATAPHARFVHEGTGLYGPKKQLIFPKRARVLSWVDPASNQRVFARYVRGMRPRPFLKDALRVLD